MEKKYCPVKKCNNYYTFFYVFMCDCQFIDLPAAPLLLMIQILIKVANYQYKGLIADKKPLVMSY